MKLLCVKNTHYENTLSIGLYYFGTERIGIFGDRQFVVTNNAGVMSTYPASCFEIVE